MYQVELDNAKAQLETILQTALGGDEVLITRNNEPVLKLVPVPQKPARRKAGSAKGLISMTDDFDGPLEDFREYMQ